MIFSHFRTLFVTVQDSVHDSIFELKCNTMLTVLTTHCSYIAEKKVCCAEIDFMFESKFHYLFEMEEKNRPIL